MKYQRFFNATELTLFERTFRTWQEAERAHPTHGGEVYAWARLPYLRAREIRLSDPPLFTEVETIYRARVVSARGRFYFWCPDSTEVLQELVEVLKAKLRYLNFFEYYRFAHLQMNTPPFFDLEEYAQGVYDPHYFRIDPGVMARQVDRDLQMQYAHILDWLSTPPMTAAEVAQEGWESYERYFAISQEAIQSAIEGVYVDRRHSFADIEARKQAEREKQAQQAERWCEANGYTEPVLQAGKWWAFPPHGVMPVPIRIWDN